jgi:hypothetical protein
MLPSARESSFQPTCRSRSSFVLGKADASFCGLEAALRYPVPVNSSRENPADPRAIGLLVVAAIILVIILVRWGGTLAWSAR